MSEFISLIEAKDISSLSYSTLYSYIKRGLLQAYKSEVKLKNKQVLYLNKSYFLAWIEKHLVETPIVPYTPQIEKHMRDKEQLWESDKAITDSQQTERIRELTTVLQKLLNRINYHMIISNSCLYCYPQSLGSRPLEGEKKHLDDCIYFKAKKILENRIY